MDKAQRFNRAFEYLRFGGYFKTQRDAASAMGATATNFGKALKGEEKVATNSFMIRFCKAYPVISLQWLLTGEGNMLTEGEVRPGEVLAAAPTEDTAAMASQLQVIESLKKKIEFLEAQNATLLQIVDRLTAAKPSV